MSAAVSIRRAFGIATLAAFALTSASCTRGVRPDRDEPVRAGKRSVGLASYYARKFHGRKTASGERYDRNAFTAAHRTLPFGTCVEVENLENGRNVQVRVNDRGPHVRGRIIDVSEAAARKLGILESGMARVAIRRC